MEESRTTGLCHSGGPEFWIPQLWGDSGIRLIKGSREGAWNAEELRASMSGVGPLGMGDLHQLIIYPACRSWETPAPIPGKDPCSLHLAISGKGVQIGRHQLASRGQGQCQGRCEYLGAGNAIFCLRSVLLLGLLLLLFLLAAAQCKFILVTKCGQGAGEAGLGAV